MFKKIEAGLF